MTTPLSEGLAYLHALEQWRGTKDFSLDSIRAVLSLLGNPQDQIRTVHVAGTNGKGSVCAMVASMLGASGARVGMTVSPHLFSPNERVLIDGMPVADQVLAEAALKLKEGCEQLNLRLSFFEGMIALAFMIFADQELDWSVLETGLGGRLDATNLVSRPELAVIVSVDLDHTHILGESLEKIAGEKAGILKSDSKLVTGSLQPGAFEVISERANKLSIPHRAMGRDFDGFSGSYLEHNRAVARACGEVLGLSEDVIEAGIKNAFWPARLEEGRLFGRRLLLDCAHNPAGFRALRGYLEAEGLREITLVCGVLNTKEWKRMPGELAPFVSEWHFVPPDSEQAVSPEELREEVSGSGVRISCHDNPDSVLRSLSESESKGPILMAGSIYLVGALRHRLTALDFRDCDIKDRPIWEPATPI